MGGLVFLVAFATLAFSFRLALRRVTQPCMPFPGGGDSQPVALIPRQLQLRGTGVAALVALVLGIFASNGWLTCIDTSYASLGHRDQPRQTGARRPAEHPRQGVSASRRRGYSDRARPSVPRVREHVHSEG